MSTCLRRAFPFACIAALAACAPPPVDEMPPIEAADLCSELAAALCDADALCCRSHSGTCEEDQTAACQVALQPLIDDPRLGYDPDRGAQFVETMRAQAEQCWEDPPDYDALVEAFAGTGAEGADCTPRDLSASSLRISSLSCARGTACRLYLRADGTTEGECAARSDDSCSHPLDCDAGEFCSLPSNWQPGTWGTCRPLRADGWECSSDLECASRHCEGTCMPMPEVRRCLQTTYPELVMSEAPTLYLPLDSARVTDASGTGQLTMVNGSVTPDEDGAIADEHDMALRFGDIGYVRVASMSELEEATALTLEAWIRPDSIDAPEPILEFSDGTDLGPHLWQFDTGDKLYTNVIDANGDGHEITTDAGALTAGEWHHVVVTYDGAHASLYLDGHRLGTTDATGPLRLTGDLYVGHRPTETDLPASFTGVMDEVAVYDHALSEDEIVRHHSAGMDGVLVNELPLFRWLAP
jgi:hypothetical protein